MRVGVFDTETTGVDPENDRIVTCAVGILADDGTVETMWEWQVNPGIPIPDAAAAIHGFTTADAAAFQDPTTAIGEIVNELGRIMTEERLPVVAYNAPYDFTLLDRELARHYPGTPQLAPAPVLDPYVLDKAMDKFRKGGRKLIDVARHYFGPARFENYQWHGAADDAIAAGQIAQLMVQDFRLAGAELHQIHGWEIQWAARQAESFADYLVKQGKDTAGVDGAWPIRDRGEG